MAEVRKDWSNRNPDKKIAAKKREYERFRLKHGPAKWKHATSEEERESRDKHSKRMWYERNKDKVAESTKRWRELNPHYTNAYVRKRQAEKLKATPKWANDFFIEEAYHLAKLRTIATGFKWHVDHIVPLKSKIVCGLHSHTNVRVIPEFLNIKKSNKYWPDMP